VKTLIGVDVAYTGDHLLVQEGGLDGSPGLIEARLEFGEGDFQCIRAKPSPILLVKGSDRGQGSETAEPPRVPPDMTSGRRAVPIPESPIHVSMGEFPGWPAILLEEKLSCHPKSDFEHTAILDLESESFSVAMHRQEATAMEKALSTG
jgi:hypothetical protein